MSKPAISIKNLSKDFMLAKSSVYSIKTLAKQILLNRKSPPIPKLRVLQDITFDIQKGESVAIVGRNGAGKSTLLSLISQIYRPTTGSIEVDGRIAPLLELGAGFHPELSGYENIFVNGMILGLTHKKLLERIDQIIEFAELEDHIRRPVRTYSTGMGARLGFSIAVHSDPDILIVDEVLGVGDYAFQAKCETRIAEIKSQGKTILVVSHSPDAVMGVADRCIWLQGGRVQMDGPAQEVLDRYHETEPD